jgi:hypothetical protein
MQEAPPEGTAKWESYCMCRIFMSRWGIPNRDNRRRAAV